MKTYTYLALGDSYTIGEQVPLAESFPYQAVQLLRKKNSQLFLNADDTNNHLQYFCAPEIVAKTGWTTDELAAAVEKTTFLPAYDLVSLLIGVNNQYRGKSADEFKIEFLQLLKMAIKFAGSIEKNVFVFSIPDWGVTPFAEGKDRKSIAKEIDEFNMVCKSIADENKCVYIDITLSQRLDGNDPDFLAADGLHPSGKEYAKWAEKLMKAVSFNG